MVKEIRLYVEGGGDGRDTKALLREGFAGFLRDLKAVARENKVNWSIVACGSRNATRDNFLTALETHRDAFNILLVDAEGPVSKPPKQHLEERDGWKDLAGVDNEACHLVAQMMEAWFIADREALANFYGQGFNINSIPGNPDVERIEKKDLETALSNATRHTSKKKYEKIQHGAKLLALIDVTKVRKSATHCNRLFEVLERQLAF